MFETSPEGLELPEDCKGDLDLEYLSSAQGLKFPKRVEGDLWLCSLINVDGVKLPEYVGGNLYLNNLNSSAGLKLPKYVGGDIHLYQLEEYDRSIHGPDELGGKVVTVMIGVDLDYMNLMIVDISCKSNRYPPRNEWEKQLKADLEEEIAEIHAKGGTVDFPVD